MRTDYLYFSNKVLLITQTRCPLVFLVLAMIFVNIKHKKTNVLGTSLTVTSFESSNTPLETWIVVLDSWIKEHKLQATALIEKKLLLLKHSGHSILLPPPFTDATPLTLIDIYFSSHHSSPILVQTIICQLLVLRICLPHLLLTIQ